MVPQPPTVETPSFVNIAADDAIPMIVRADYVTGITRDRDEDRVWTTYVYVLGDTIPYQTSLDPILVATLVANAIFGLPESVGA